MQQLRVDRGDSNLRGGKKVMIGYSEKAIINNEDDDLTKSSDKNEEDDLTVSIAFTRGADCNS